MPRESADPRRLRQMVLASGLRLAIQPAPPGSQSFSATYVGPAGWAYDRPGQEGGAVALSQLLTSGAGRWDRRELDRLLDRMGATLTRACHPESSEVTAWGPRELTRGLLDVLASVVVDPHLKTADLDRVRRQLLERQSRESTQPDSRAERDLARAVFPRRHPYRLSGLGTPRSARALTAGSLRRFHHTHFTCAGGLLVVTGAPTSFDVEREVRRRFDGVLTERAPPTPEIPAVPRLGTRELRVELAGRSQVEIRIGGSSVRRSSEHFPGVFLANEVLGARPSLSRLFQTVREGHGLAYHASSEVEAMRWGGYWVAGAGTGPERIEATERLVKREIARIGSVLIPPRELDRIRESAIGELPLSLETTAGAHDLAVDVAYHDLPDDFLVRWPDVLRALSPAEVRSAAQVGLNADQAVTIVAGPPALPRRSRGTRTRRHVSNRGSE